MCFVRQAGASCATHSCGPAAVGIPHSDPVTRNAASSTDSARPILRRLGRYARVAGALCSATVVSVGCMILRYVLTRGWEIMRCRSNGNTASRTYNGRCLAAFYVHFILIEKSDSVVDVWHEATPHERCTCTPRQNRSFCFSRLEVENTPRPRAQLCFGE